MKILVTGGAGYIGSHTVLELLRANHEVVVFDNLSTGDREFVPPQVPFILGDIRNESDLVHLFSKHNFDLVMHFAAKLLVDESIKDPLEYYHNNLEGLRMLLTTMIKFNVKNFVFSSTAAVYGDAKDICHEDDYLIPINPYGESKLACEKMIKWAAQAHGFNYCIFRYFNVAGADHSLTIGLKKEQFTHLIPLAINAALDRNNSFKINGNDYPTIDGTCVRDYIHITDLAKAHILGAQYLLNGGQSEIFNLGSATGYSVLQVVNVVNNIIPLEFCYGPKRIGDPASLIADSSKALQILDWKAQYSLTDIISSDLAYRKQFIK